MQQAVTLTQTATAVSNGLFTSTLDFGNQFPGADRWLEIAVRTNGGGAFSTLAPRQALTPTPYAIFAGKVNASGISGTLAPGNIANGTITTLMLANGAVGSNQLAAGAVTTTALANGAVTAAKVATVSNLFSLTIANPTPENGDSFGSSVAAVGNDCVFIGALGDSFGGSAYLFGPETFTDGLVADAVRTRSVITASLEDGAVTADKIGGVLFTSQIPDLDASTIVSGTLNTNRIPNLDAAKITSGVLNNARIPNLDASKITGTFKRLTVAGAGAFASPNAAALILDNTTPVTGRRWEWHSLDNGKMQLADFDAAATRLVVDTNGNVGIGTASPNAPLEVIGEVKATVFTPTSDRHAKEKFAPVNPAEVLQKVAALPSPSGATRPSQARGTSARWRRISTPPSAWAAMTKAFPPWTPTAWRWRRSRV